MRLIDADDLLQFFQNDIETSLARDWCSNFDTREIIEVIENQKTICCDTCRNYTLDGLCATYSIYYDKGCVCQNWRDNNDY